MQRSVLSLSGMLIGVLSLLGGNGLIGCNKEDVAPQQAQPANAAWDAPVQEKPSTPGQEGAPSEHKDMPPQGEGQPEAVAPPAPGPNGELPPPPEGEDIPMGAPPLPDGVKGVALKGTVVFADYKQGFIQIDVSDRAMKNGNRGSQPKVIQLFRMEKPGPFQLDLPENQGEVHLSAYNDEDKNGRPSREEARGSARDNPYTIKGTALEGVQIVLEREKIPAPP